jgi:hypothetical protein
MFALLSPRLWIAVALALVLATTNFMAYRSGKAAVRASWDAEKAAQAVALAKANEQARAQEQARQAKVTEALNAANTRARKAQAAAAAARATADSLRDDLNTARADLPGASCASTRSYAATLTTVFGECTREVERLAAAAQGHASDALTLQQAWPRSNP